MINHFWESSPEQIQEFMRNNSLGIADVKKFEYMEDAFAALLAGNAVFFMEGYDRAMKISSKGYPNMGVSGAETEKVLRGSREGFSDSVKTNSALVRKRLRDTRMKVEEMSIGVRSNTVLQLLYIEDLVHQELLQAIKDRLEEFEIDGILDSGMLEQLTEEAWYSPFPQYQTTERPDRAAQELLNGKVVVICDNTPYALILPSSFNGFMESSEDWYHHFEMASFFKDSALSGADDCGASSRALSGSDTVSHSDSSHKPFTVFCRGQGGSALFQCCGACVSGTCPLNL